MKVVAVSNPEATTGRPRTPGNFVTYPQQLLGSIFVRSGPKGTHPCATIHPFQAKDEHS